MKKIILSIVILFFIIILVDLWFLRVDKSQESAINEDMENINTYQKVSFLTADGVKIIGNYYTRKGNYVRRIVLFLHMMPATKESWDALAKELQKKGITSLAIDLRGHGESTQVQGSRFKVKSLDYRDFSDEEHQASKLDVEGVLKWLQKEKGFKLADISIGGASIGANLALQALGEYPEVKKGIALSPGLNYRGIEPKSFVEKLRQDQAVFYATSKDDGDNVKMTEELYNATKAEKEWKVYDNAGHGTTMLEKANDLIPSIVEFILK